MAPNWNPCHQPRRFPQSLQGLSNQARLAHLDLLSQLFPHLHLFPASESLQRQLVSIFDQIILKALRQVLGLGQIPLKQPGCSAEAK